MAIQELTIRTPDDWHLHLRDHELLHETVPATSRCFERAIVMPNLTPPVTTAARAEAYRQRILAAVPAGQRFEPLMTLYLTDQTSAQDITDAKVAGVVAAKLYPAGATTNSSAAVNSLERLDPVFAALAEAGMPLLVHGEVTDAEIDIFDREKSFIDRHLSRIVAEHPQLKVVFEHITTADAVEFVQQGPDRLAATLTPQHLLMNRNDLLVGGIRPHNYCLPILKRATHQRALLDAVASGSGKFFLGTDSAPHSQSSKESSCGCAGCYSAWSALELYAQIFDNLGVLDKLEAFASEHGANFYGLPLNTGRLTLVRERWTVPERIQLANGESMVPFYVGKTVQWKLSTTR